MIAWLAALALQAAVAPPPPEVVPAPEAAPGEPGRCTLRNGTMRWSGRCRVAIEPGGTFTVNPWDGQTLPDGLLAVSVAVFAPGKAEVRGLTGTGINSRWGEAARVRNARGCWGAADFRVCAWRDGVAKTTH